VLQAIVLKQVNAAADRLAEANKAPRCYHVKTNGLRCGSPSTRGTFFCFFHDLRLYNRAYSEEMPLVEDGNAVQIALQQVLEALRKNKIDRPLANSLFYGLQIASANLSRVDFQPIPSKVVQLYPSAASDAEAAPEAVVQENEKG